MLPEGSNEMLPEGSNEMLPDFTTAMDQRFDVLRQKPKPSKSLFTQLTHYFYPKKTQELSQSISRGTQVFEVAMVACPTYKWTIHGGRTGYIEEVWNGKTKKYESANSITNYIAPKKWHREFTLEAENQELPSLDTKTRQILRSIWKGLEKKKSLTVEQNDERLVVYQTVLHSRYSYDEQVYNYMATTTLLGEEIRKQLIGCCIKAGITPNDYNDAIDFLLAAKEGLGVYIYPDFMSAPKSGQTPFLAEVKVAHSEMMDGMHRVDHPGANYVKKGLFFFVN